MAIAFARAILIHLTLSSDVTRVVAYVARTIMRAVGRRRTYDYRYLNDDLVYEVVIPPPNAPEDFKRKEVFAHAIDLKEILKLRTPLHKRIRPPQLALAVVVALPPATEVARHEAVEIMRRIVIKARGSHNLPIHVAIHHKSVNQHGHATFALRPIHPDGSLGLKIRDHFAILRTKGASAEGDVVEGLNWPKLTWETHLTFFVERGIDLVVDPAAPEPGEHLRAFIFDNGEFHDEDVLRRIHADRQRLHKANIKIIRGSPTVLLHKLLRGRSSLQIEELRRLSARFCDGEEQRSEAVDRILIDQNVITTADHTDAERPRYATTRRVERLVRRATKLLEGSPGEFRAVTGPDHETVVAQIAELAEIEENLFAEPLILGLTLSDCDEIKNALAHLKPVAGTIDMAVTAPAAKRKQSKTYSVRLTPGRIVIVPRAERVDDQRLARLLVAASSVGAKVALGHDQSRETGIVCGHLAAFIADRSKLSPSPAGDDDNALAIVRMLRAGLMQRAVAAMVEHDLVTFGSHPIKTSGDKDYFVVCDDPRRIIEANEAARNEQIRLRLIEQPETLSGPIGETALALGEWVVATRKSSAKDPERPVALEEHQLARIVAIDSENCWIDVLHRGHVDRLDLTYTVSVRPAAAISLRQTWDAPPDAELGIEITSFSNVWAALVLGASRLGRARIFVDPTVARNAEELAAAARRSIPGCLPHTRLIQRDADAKLNKIFWEVFPEFTPRPPIVVPRLIGLAEELRKRLAGHSGRMRTYELLCEYVAPQNPNHRQNLMLALDCSQGALTRALIRLAAERTPSASRGEFDALDLPAALSELSPDLWSDVELAFFQQDLDRMAVPYLGPLWQPINRPHSRQVRARADDPENFEL
jgi:hypothetical protein